jgi:GNAT superfamily N-acetyltransferase
MIQIQRTSTENTDFLALVKELDAELAIRDGDEHDFYDQFNKLHNIKYVVVAYLDGVAVGCGAIKEYAPDTMEVKRMFVPLQQRGKGIATAVLQALEVWAKELGYAKCILETGIRQPEAISLYKKNQYQITANYGQYKDAVGSVCFEKLL